jgi:hypothetical protein
MTRQQQAAIRATTPSAGLPQRCLSHDLLRRFAASPAQDRRGNGGSRQGGRPPGRGAAPGGFRQSFMDKLFSASSAAAAAEESGLLGYSSVHPAPGGDGGDDDDWASSVDDGVQSSAGGESPQSRRKADASPKSPTGRGGGGEREASHHRHASAADVARERRVAAERTAAKQREVRARYDPEQLCAVVRDALYSTYAHSLAARDGGGGASPSPAGKQTRAERLRATIAVPLLPIDRRTQLELAAFMGDLGVAVDLPAPDSNEQTVAHVPANNAAASSLRLRMAALCDGMPRYVASMTVAEVTAVPRAVAAAPRGGVFHTMLVHQREASEAAAASAQSHAVALLASPHPRTAAK